MGSLFCRSKNETNDVKPEFIIARAQSMMVELQMSFRSFQDQLRERIQRHLHRDLVSLVCEYEVRYHAHDVESEQLDRFDRIVKDLPVQFKVMMDRNFIAYTAGNCLSIGVSLDSRVQARQDAQNVKWSTECIDSLFNIRKFSTSGSAILFMGFHHTGARTLWICLLQVFCPTNIARYHVIVMDPLTFTMLSAYQARSFDHDTLRHFYVWNEDTHAKELVLMGNHYSERLSFESASPQMVWSGQHDFYQPWMRTALTGSNVTIAVPVIESQSRNSAIQFWQGIGPFQLISTFALNVITEETWTLKTEGIVSNRKLDLEHIRIHNMFSLFPGFRTTEFFLMLPRNCDESTKQHPTTVLHVIDQNTINVGHIPYSTSDVRETRERVVFN